MSRILVAAAADAGGDLQPPVALSLAQRDRGHDVGSSLAIAPQCRVLVSALISPGGPSAALLLELRAGAFELLVSPALLAELREVLARPGFRSYLTPAEIATCVELIEHEGTIHEDPPPSGQALSADPDYEYLIDLARATVPDALVSGDAHLLGLRGAIPVMAPAEFLGSLASH